MPYGKIFRELKARFTEIMAQPGAAPQKKLSAADQELMINMLAGATATVRHEQEMSNARGTEPLTVRLVPQVPVRDYDEAVGWVGGGARLPPGMAWPKIGDSPLQLLLQIDCARLPARLWGGLGPRHGWLAIFLDPLSFKARVLHFAEVGDFKPSPPILEDCNIAGYDGRKRAEAGYTSTFSRWPVDIVPVVLGRKDPRREARSQIRHERYRQRHDIVAERRLPFDWSTAQMMMDLALAAYDRAMPKGPAEFLTPEALAKSAQAILDAERAGTNADELAGMRVNHDERRAMAAILEFNLKNGATVVDRLRALKADVDAMAVSQGFSADAIAPILTELQAMTWMHKSVPPPYRNSQKLSNAQRLKEGVQAFALPLTTHDPSALPGWVHDFETHLRDAAKQVYLSDPAALPAALVADCERVWRDEAASEIAGVGHVPWGYVHDFDDAEDMTLVELPSSSLIGWMFGDVNNLVITVKKTDLFRNDFSQPLVQVTN